MLVWLLNSFHLHSHQHDLQASQTQSSKALSKLKKLSKAYQVLCFHCMIYIVNMRGRQQKWFKLCNCIYTKTNLNLSIYITVTLADETFYLHETPYLYLATISADRESRVSITEIKGEPIGRWEQQTSPGTRTGMYIFSHAQWLNICLLIIKFKHTHTLVQLYCDYSPVMWQFLLVRVSKYIAYYFHDKTVHIKYIPTSKCVAL